ncbi:uncharacterized protein Z519_07468 [Cladophialophora bantiana CBS 173.52]|uniref:Xylanolytic transcriptional activator regulatory domain-containing protein n=1 Tax=Cladophialophora bantiana (strain ATCC 10958 / CBS 173.52 / CDC B-1940 / NIH 8579) TaxID=1442370 RepID=A0A0D2FYJ9_CLAB1|nr:uncharacterized protein Z519_07468 [Cladophialophora bantiana CBS 173.52]KIW91502.1 hypothetical protein Z519_07468 [Cladophialophora bantiana CBS 173.52]
MPCHSCTIAGADCEFRANDWKRTPISREHVAALEGRIAALESLLSSVKSSRGYEREIIIENIDIVDRRPTITDSAQASVHADDIFLQSMRGCWGNDGHGLSSYNFRRSRLIHSVGSACFYGPGSAFSTGLFGFCEPGSKLLNHQAFPTTQTPDVPVNVLHDCVKLFFEWQFPYCNMIDRESFLREYSSGIAAGEHFASALLYAVCSLGALMSADQNIKALASLFATSAEEEISSKFWRSHITISQAMLLCAVFEIGRGEFAKGWMYSGMAFRMTDHLGIHEYNQLPSRKGIQSTWSVGFKSWRRMSLTYAISDKMLSLFFGRPSAMNRAGNDFDMKMSNWSNSNDAEILEHRQMASMLIPNTAGLARIIEDIQAEVFNSDHISRHAAGCGVDALYHKFNARLWNWHDSLPGEMRWNRWSSKEEDADPSLALLHILFHTARISLNRPLISQKGMKSPSAQIPKIVSDALGICKDSVDTIVQIIRRFRTWHTLRTASFAFVHGAIMAIDAAIIIISCSETDNALSMKMNADPLSTLDTALNDLSHTWAIAQDARSRLHEIINASQLDLGMINETPLGHVSASTDFWSECLDIHAATPEPMFFPCAQRASQTHHTTQRRPSLYSECLMATSLEDASGPLDCGMDFNSAPWNSLATSESGMAFNRSLKHQ